MLSLLTIERYIYTRLGVLTTIHMTYINKESLYTINTLYSTVSSLIHSLFSSSVMQGLNE